VLARPKLKGSKAVYSGSKNCPHVCAILTVYIIVQEWIGIPRTSCHGLGVLHQGFKMSPYPWELVVIWWHYVVCKTMTHVDSFLTQIFYIGNQVF
jgi:hypothetical protein